MLFRPPSVQILAVPHIQQRRTGECLAACALMICSYLEVAVDYQRLVRLLETQDEVGVSFSKIHNLEKLRLTVVYQKGGTLSKLYNLLTAGWPSIVSVQTKELPYRNGVVSLHAVVLVGIEVDACCALINFGF